MNIAYYYEDQSIFTILRIRIEFRRKIPGHIDGLKLNEDMTISFFFACL